MPRENYLPQIKLGDDEWDMLHTVAQHRGIDLDQYGAKAGLVRALIREEAARLAPRCPQCGTFLQIKSITDLATAFGMPDVLPRPSLPAPFSHAWVCPSCGQEDAYVAGAAGVPKPPPSEEGVSE